MSLSGPDLRVEPMRLRQRPDAELAALFAGGWPSFIDADRLAARHLPTVRATFGDLEVALLQDDVLVGAGWGVPIAWNGSSDELPSGYSDALARAVDGHRDGVLPNTLVICAGQVHPDLAGAGLAAVLLEGLINNAAAAGLVRVVAPLRPTRKHRYPLTAIEDYVRWTRSDGSAFDPWLRTHLRMGAHVLGVGLVSQTFTGSVEQWQRWSGLDMPGDGDYVVPGALAPVHIDQATDSGTCVEPTIWVRHR